jgi:hypothetical protein
MTVNSKYKMQRSWPKFELRSQKFLAKVKKKEAPSRENQNRIQVTELLA